MTTKQQARINKSTLLNPYFRLSEIMPMNGTATESNDTVLQASLRQIAAAANLEVARTGNPISNAEPLSEPQIMEPIQLSFIRQISHFFIDPFGLLQRVVINSRLPPLVAEFSFFVILSLTALWDIILLILIFLLAWRVLLAIGYVIKKLSWFICCMASGQNQTTLKQFLRNKRPRRENARDDLNMKLTI